MPEHTIYPAGTPSWIDLMATDLDAEKQFYGSMFGWEWQGSEPADQTGGYGMFKLGDHNIAGAGPKQMPEVPTAWTTYISVDSAAATAEKVTAAGGQVIVAPMQVLEAGTMAIFADSGGGVFGVWQPDQHIGADLVDEPGAMTWNELTTRDTDGAAKFYAEVFGWTCHRMESGPETVYFEWKLNDLTVGGMLAMGDHFPPEVPPYWSPYIAVDDADAAVAKVKQLGGRVFMQPTDVPVGRFAAMADAEGAMFNVIKLNNPPG